ncbi:MAG: hypothetical protein N3A61_02820 [Ignavibacteria bacterium]|nr:hypothetical protein [Ignavibacteria bacterium]
MEDKKILRKSQAAIYEPDVLIWTNLDCFSTNKETDYHKIVEECRFFYRTDPIASTVINKLVEIGVSDIIVDVSELSPNESKIFTCYLDKIKKFIRQCALEYLITGMVVPEITFEIVEREELKDLGIKKYSQLYLPTSMWVRNSEHIKINHSFLGDDKPSYFIKIPQEMINFVTSGGVYSDGTVDKERYKWLAENFPDFISAIKAGKTELPLDNPLIIRRLYLADSPYPIPYLYPALEPLKHKRNLRLMDYALAGRVIQAIQHIKVGSDEFPLLEGEEGVFDDIKMQLRQGNILSKQVEKIIQLFTNHTVSIEWVIPDVSAIFNSQKYEEINNDVFFALGFPRILTVGETLRTQASNHELATKSPIKTMEKMQEDLIPIVKYIINKIRTKNNLTSNPSVRFKRVDFHQFSDFINGLFELRNQGGISLETLCNYFGIDYSDEKVKIENENNP